MEKKITHPKIKFQKPNPYFNNRLKYKISYNFPKISTPTNPYSPSNPRTQNHTPLSKSSSDFFKRNYDSYLYKINRRNKCDSPVMSATELNYLLYKLKKNNNEVSAINKKKDSEINFLKQTLNFEESRLNQLINFQDIELADEKISVRNFNEIKLTRDEVEKKLKNYLKEKQELDDVLKNEAEYYKTIEYMFEDEKSRLLSIKKETNVVEEQLHNVYQFQKIIDYNLQKNAQKDIGYQQIKKSLQNNLELTKKISETQKERNENLDQEIFDKESEVNDLEERAKNLREENKLSYAGYQKNINEQLLEIKEKEKEKKVKEKKYIEIIYCLYLIQKFFINEDHFDLDSLLSNKDYNSLLNNKFEILRTQTRTQTKSSQKNNMATTSSIFTSKTKEKNEIKNEDQKKKKISNKTTNNPTISDNQNNDKRKEIKSKTDRAKSTKEKLNLNIFGFNKQSDANTKLPTMVKSEDNLKQKSRKKNKFQTETLASQNSKKSYKVLIQELKERFDQIKLTTKTLLDYNSRLTSKLNFYTMQFDEFHRKELDLEAKKAKAYERAKQVINEDYLTFDELAKNNTKIKEFIKKNKNIISEIKHNNKKQKLKSINNQIINEDDNINFNVNLLNNKQKNEKIKKDQIKNNSEVMFNSARDLILSNKNFFMKCYDYLKQIIICINIDKEKEMQNNDEEKINPDNKFQQQEEENYLIKMIIDLFKNLKKFLKLVSSEIEENRENFMEYLNNLKNACIENENLKNIFDENEINENLINIFYKDKEQTHISKTFYTQFLSKNLPMLQDLYNHFSIFLDPTINNIKQIVALIDELNFSHNVSKIIINKYTSKTQKSFLNYSYIQQKQKSHYNRNNSNLNEKKQKEEDYFAELEAQPGSNDDDTEDTQSIKKKKVYVKKKYNSIEENIIKNLYSPFMEKTSYLRKLNSNMKTIKSMSTRNCKNNHYIKKRQNEVDNTTQQMLLYNNPLINPNKLAKHTYNSLIKLVIDNNSNSKNEYKTDKKNRSTSAPHYKINKK